VVTCLFSSQPPPLSMSKRLLGSSRTSFLGSVRHIVDPGLFILTGRVRRMVPVGGAYGWARAFLQRAIVACLRCVMSRGLALCRSFPVHRD
jgi:hypothetical protein